MQTETIAHDDIRYNAAEQQFEACVTLHGAQGLRTFACTFQADLTTSLDDAATALRDAAIARHFSAPGLFSAPKSLAPSPLRNIFRTTWRDRLLRSLPSIRRLETA